VVVPEWWGVITTTARIVLLLHTKSPPYSPKTEKVKRSKSRSTYKHTIYIFWNYFGKIPTRTGKGKGSKSIKDGQNHHTTDPECLSLTGKFRGVVSRPIRYPDQTVENPK